MLSGSIKDADVTTTLILHEAAESLPSRCRFRPGHRDEGGEAMSKDDKPFGLSAAAKASLLARLAEHEPRSRKDAPKRAKTRTLPSDDIDKLGPYREMQIVRSAGEFLGIENPFFRVHDGKAGAETSIDGRRYINFSSYDYLGLNGHPRVVAAAKAAIDRYGTSVSASRLVSGERAVHRELEHGLAETLGTEDCVVLVSGHATFVTVIGHLFSRNDLILHDALIHNSILCGAMLSGAQRVSFPHNDVEAAGRLLAQHRARSSNALIVIEGLYSMDGDVPNLPAFVELAERHNCWILVDEAHSLGVLGRRGFGIAEHFGVDPESVDLWMGTLSKTLASAGGYIAGRKKLIEYLKYSAPGFVYSVGMPPPVAAAAHAALEVLCRRTRTRSAAQRECTPVSREC